MTAAAGVAADVAEATEELSRTAAFLLVLAGAVALCVLPLSEGFEALSPSVPAKADAANRIMANELSKIRFIHSSFEDVDVVWL